MFPTNQIDGQNRNCDYRFRRIFPPCHHSTESKTPLALPKLSFNRITDIMRSAGFVLQPHNMQYVKAVRYYNTDIQKYILSLPEDPGVPRKLPEEQE